MISKRYLCCLVILLALFSSGNAIKHKDSTKMLEPDDEGEGGSEIDVGTGAMNGLSKLVGKALEGRNLDEDDPLSDGPKNPAADVGLTNSLAQAIRSKKEEARAVHAGAMDPMVRSLAKAFNAARSAPDQIGNIVKDLNTKKGEEGETPFDSKNEIAVAGSQDQMIDLLSAAIVEADRMMAEGTSSASTKVELGTNFPEPPGASEDSSSSSDENLGLLMAEAVSKAEKVKHLDEWLMAATKAIEKTKKGHSQVTASVDKLMKEMEELKKKRGDIIKKVKAQVLKNKLKAFKKREGELDAHAKRLDSVAQEIQKHHDKIRSNIDDLKTELTIMAAAHGNAGLNDNTTSDSSAESTDSSEESSTEINSEESDTETGSSEESTTSASGSSEDEPVITSSEDEPVITSSEDTPVTPSPTS